MKRVRVQYLNRVVRARFVAMKLARLSIRIADPMTHRISSTFLHLSKILVETGTEVKKGDLIAEIGATGRASGPHLDWRMNWLDKRVDPQVLVKGNPQGAALSD